MSLQNSTERKRSMRKKTKRKVWQIVNPIAHAIEGATIVPETRLQSLRLLELAAIESFAKGKATVQDWQTMTAMLNVCETMGLNGIGREALEACKRLQDSLIESQQRYDKTKKMGATGLALQAMRDVYEYADLQRSSIDLSTFEKMVKTTIARVKSKAPEVVEL